MAKTANKLKCAPENCAECKVRSERPEAETIWSGVALFSDPGKRKAEVVVAASDAITVNSGLTIEDEKEADE